MTGGVACVLFTDIVGSTELMSHLGDTAGHREARLDLLVEVVDRWPKVPAMRAMPARADRLPAGQGVV